MWIIDASPEEQEDIRIVEDHLRRLVKYAEDFSEALSLFNFCTMFGRQFTGRWDFVAARDGAMTIYHIGKTIELTRAALKRASSLGPLVNVEVLSEAGKRYREAFPTFEKMRHAVSHSSELYRDKKNSQNNTADGFVGLAFNFPRGSGQIVVSGCLIGRHYTNTIDGSVISYEISEATKRTIYDCANTFMSGFAAVYALDKFRPEAPSPKW